MVVVSLAIAVRGSDRFLGDPEPPQGFTSGAKVPRGFVADQFMLTDLCFTQAAVTTVINSWVICDNSQVDIKQCIDITAAQLAAGTLDFAEFPALRIFYDPLSARLYSLDNRRLAIAKFVCDQIDASWPYCTSPIPVVWANRLEVQCTANNIPDLGNWRPPGYAQTCRELGFSGNHWDTMDQGEMVNIRPGSFAGNDYASVYKCQPWYVNSSDTSSMCGQPTWIGNQNPQWWSSTGEPLQYFSPENSALKCSAIASPPFPNGFVSISVINPAGQRTRVMVAQSPFEASLLAYSQVFDGGKLPTLSGAFVPSEPSRIDSLWRTKKESIAAVLAPIPVQQFDTTTWRNMAESTNDLYNLAQTKIETFKTLLQTVVNDINDNGQSYVSYGPGDRFITKSMSSLERKVLSQQQDRGVKAPWTTIDDAIRGTVVVPSVAAFKVAISSLLSVADSSGHLVSLDNKFAQNKQSGYVGVHAAVYVSKVLIGEVQIHFKQIMDGTQNCPKEYTHGIYELTRLAPPGFRWSVAEANAFADFGDDYSQRYNSWSYGWKQKGDQNPGEFQLMSVFDNVTNSWQTSMQTSVPNWCQTGGQPSETQLAVLRYTYTGLCPAPVAVNGFFQNPQGCSGGQYARIRKNSAIVWQIKQVDATASYFSVVTRLASGDQLDFELEQNTGGGSCTPSLFQPEIITLSYCPNQYEETGNVAQKFVFLFGLQSIPLELAKNSGVNMPHLVSNESESEDHDYQEEYIYSSGVLYRSTLEGYSAYSSTQCRYNSIGADNRLEDLDVSGTHIDFVHSARVVSIENSLCNVAPPRGEKSPQPSWWTATHILYLVGMLLFIIIAAGAGTWYFYRRRRSYDSV